MQIKLPTAEEYRWLASQRPRNKRQNRILLLNAKRPRLLEQLEGGMTNHSIINIPQDRSVV